MADVWFVATDLSASSLGPERETMFASSDCDSRFPTSLPIARLDRRMQSVMMLESNKFQVEFVEN